MAEGLPDWTAYSVMKAVDEDGNIITIAVDAEGNIVAKMTGVYNSATKNIAVDSEGRMIALTYGNLGGSGVDGSKHVTSNENLDPDVWYNYTDLTIDAGVTLGLSAVGKMLIRCSGVVTINGTISVDEKGCAGGAVAANGENGNPGAAENNGGLCAGGGGGTTHSQPPYTQNGGAGGASTDTGCGAGGAGGVNYSDAGGAGQKASINQHITKDFAKEWHVFIVNRGSGGGSGGAYSSGATGGAGGAGGGIIYIEALKIIIASGAQITAKGGDGADANLYHGSGGAGSGGTIFLMARDVENSGTLDVSGGSGGDDLAHPGGNGGDGLVKIVKQF